MMKQDQWMETLAASAPDDFAVLREMARLIRGQGGCAYLVGGCVRDVLQGVPGHDFDVEVHGIEADTLHALLSAHWELNQVGASFGIVKLAHRDIDVALPRRENLVGKGHRDFSIATDPHLGIAEAAARRDFTINAMMLDLTTGELVDPWHGREDLAKGILRHVSDHFVEDPLRVLRAMQFLARFPLVAAPETIEVCSRMSQEHLPPERIAGEWEKLLLKGEKPSRGLQFLRACGWLRFYPELAALVGCEQYEVFHPEGDVWRHTCLALDATVPLRTGSQEDDLVRALAVLLHDVGKPATTCMGPKGHLVAWNHEVEGLPLAERFLKRMWNQPHLVRDILVLVQNHMRPVPLQLEGCGPRAYRRLSVEVKRLDLLADVVECDMRGTLATEETLRIVRDFRSRIKELAIDKAPPSPIVGGKDLIRLGFHPGPFFGEILGQCYEAQLSGEFTEREGGLAYLENLLKEQKIVP